MLRFFIIITLLAYGLAVLCVSALATAQTADSAASQSPNPERASDNGAGEASLTHAGRVILRPEEGLVLIRSPAFHDAQDDGVPTVNGLPRSPAVEEESLEPVAVPQGARDRQDDRESGDTATTDSRVDGPTRPEVSGPSVDRPGVDRPGAPAMRASTTAQTPWAVQVGAFRDPEEAWDMLDTIVRAMGSDVTGEDARVAVAGPASDTLYRARLNAATESAARALCGTLQERGFECFVDGPGGED